MTRFLNLLRRLNDNAWFWLLLAVAVGLFSTGRWTVAVAAWLAPLFLLRFTRLQRPLPGYLLATISSYLLLIVTWWGLQPLPLPIFLGMFAVTAPIGALPYLFDRLLTPRLRTRDGRSAFISTLIFPLAVTAIEFVSMTGSPLGSFGATAYSQYGNLILLQLLAVGGMWLVSFVIHWFAAVVNWAWDQGFAWPSVRRGLAVYAVAMLAVAIFGIVRLATAPTPAVTTPIAGFTAQSLVLEELIPLYEQDITAFRRETQAIHATYLAQSEAQAAAGARILLWPEGAGIGVAEDVAALVATGQALAQRTGAYLAMPTFTFFPGEERSPENRLLIAAPDGTIVLNHIKFGGNEIEGTLRGDGILQSVATPYGVLSGVICWDTDFPAAMQQLGRAGVDILLSPARDWEEISPLHGQMSAFRAIENGVTVIRQADQGWSVVTDPFGRTLASMDHFTDAARLLTASVPTAGVWTLYPVIGDAFGWLTVVGFLALALWALVAGRRRSQASAAPTSHSLQPGL